jgi:hypothetical protein
MSHPNLADHRLMSATLVKSVVDHAGFHDAMH